jgi:hypothetical protein
MIYLVLAMVLLTFAVLIFAFSQRVIAVRRKKIRISYFRSMSAEQVPPQNIVLSTRHFANLFEMPMLFYVAAVLIVLMKIESTLLVFLAWGYVFFRLIHCVIHVSYNNVVHRMSAFFMGNILLLIMWCIIAKASL